MPRIWALLLSVYWRRSIPPRARRYDHRRARRIDERAAAERTAGLHPDGHVALSDPRRLEPDDRGRGQGRLRDGEAQRALGRDPDRPRVREPLARVDRLAGRDPD